MEKLFVRRVQLHEYHKKGPKFFKFVRTLKVSLLNMLQLIELMLCFVLTEDMFKKNL